MFHCVEAELCVNPILVIKGPFTWFRQTNATNDEANQSLSWNHRWQLSCPV